MSADARTSADERNRWSRPRPRIGVSSCLLGERVRYDGGHCRDRFLTDVLAPHVEWAPVCPEDESGLGVPRELLRLEGSAVGTRVRDSTTGVDHTDALVGVADAREGEFASLDGCVLKSTSPSCGLFALPVFSGDGRHVEGRGRGAFADRLLRLHPFLPAEEEGRLSDPELRDHFMEQVFAGARLRALFTPGWQPRELVAFHSRHKLQVMAHSPEAYRLLGRITARAGSDESGAIEDEYTTAFRGALAQSVTPGRHVNALHHAFGMVSDLLDDTRRHDILAAIDGYRAGTVPLSLPAALVRRHCAAEGVSWAAEQTYLDPFPPELALRDSLPKS